MGNNNKERIRKNLEHISSYFFFKDILNGYVGGRTYEELVSDYGLDNYFTVKETTARRLLGEIINEFVSGDYVFLGGTFTSFIKEKIKKRKGRSNLEKYLNGENEPRHFSKLNKEERADISMNGVISRGRIPYSSEEKGLALSLADSLEYHSEKGTNWKKVAKEVNNKYNNNRSVKSIRMIVYRSR